MNPIEPILAQQPLIILDGALATELERHGHNLDDPLWSAKLLLEAPEFIQAVHDDYLQAGADCLITATYQATYAGFKARGVSEAEATMLMQRSVQLAVDARDNFWADHAAGGDQRVKPIIAASIGPYGAYLADGSEYHGNYGLSLQALIDFHRPRLVTLADTAVDLFAFETIPCLLEAQALTQLLLTLPAQYAWVSFTAKDDQHIRNGEPFVDCVRWLNPYDQIVAIGINCTAPRHVTPLIQMARTVTDKPLIIYPNSGEGYDSDQHTWTGSTDYDDFGQQAQEWYQAGAALIGGCCRTTPADIQQIANWARTLPGFEVSA